MDSTTQDQRMKLWRRNMDPRPRMFRPDEPIVVEDEDVSAEQVERAIDELEARLRKAEDRVLTLEVNWERDKQHIHDLKNKVQELMICPGDIGRLETALAKEAEARERQRETAAKEHGAISASITALAERVGRAKDDQAALVLTAKTEMDAKMDVLKEKELRPLREQAIKWAAVISVIIGAISIFGVWVMERLSP